MRIKLKVELTVLLIELSYANQINTKNETNEQQSSTLIIILLQTIS